ncbi:MAG: hypothetical protein E7264_08265 [Lachnospiraceae bacterium]|nr:hypothetical protein [Lachnospiraceae bacterium]
MDFNVSFQDSEKRKMNIVIFFFSLIFILSIMGAVWLQISWESEARFLIWFVVYFVGLFEIFLLLRWQDCKTWMIAKKENSISYRNRFGKIKETQVVDIIKVEVNRYARIKVLCEGDKVFLSRNLWEYPGMMELVTVFRNNKSIFGFQDEETEKQFWESVNYFV